MLKKVLIVLALIFVPDQISAGEQIAIATADGIPLSTPEGDGFHDQVIQEAFRRIGMELQIVHLPAERALINANEGIEKGVYVRIEGIEKTYRNLRRVPEKITDYHFVVFSRDKTLPITNWSSLQPYDVAIINGWKILEHNITQSKSLLKVKNANLLFQLLADDKVDCIVYNRLDGYGTIKKLGLDHIHAIDPPLAIRAMYLYLNKDHQNLITGLTEALQAMKEDGTYDRIRTSSLAPYLPQ